MSIIEQVKAVLAAEAAAIERIPLDQSFEQAIATLEDRKGKIVVTGMGKAGHVARKFAAVLSSTGSPAVFVHPGEAAHGDLGVVQNGDCLIALSTSGQTREVLEMVQFARHLNCAQVIGVTSHRKSGLRELCDVVLDMGIIAEPCPLGLTPTASVAAMAALTDAIAIVLMSRAGVTRHDYGLRHHGGYLGRKSREDNVLPDEA